MTLEEVPYIVRGERLSGRALSSPEELDRESLSQTDSLLPSPERRALRGVGTAGIVRCRDPRGVQTTTLVEARTGRRAQRVRRLPAPYRVFFYNGFSINSAGSGIQLTKQPVHNLSGAQH